MKPISINQLAFGSIRRRSRQYLTLAIGVFLAVYFAAVMLLFGASIPQTLQTMHNDRQGNQDYVFFNIGDAPMDELVQAGLVAEYGMTEILAETEKRPNTNFSAFSLARFDQKALQMTGKRLISGRLPDKAGEIALEQETLSLQRITAKPGDIISLVLKIPDGSDYLTKTITKEYLLTGILADQRLYLLNEVYDSHYAYKDYPAAILSDSEKIEVGGMEIRTAYVKLAPGIDPQDLRLLAFAARYSIDLKWTGFDGASVLVSGDPGTNEVITVLGIAVFMALLLLLSACLGIVNTFTSNLQQRKQQIGLIRAVGATRRQIRMIIGREALLMSILSIPSALALGCLTVWGMTSLFGSTYHFSPQPLILLVVALFGIASVWFSSRIPLRRVAQIPPMQAIRDADLSRRMKKRKIKSCKQFQLSYLLASRNIKLHNNSLLGISVFIILSLVLAIVIPFYMEGNLQRILVNYQADFVIQASRGQEDLINYQYHVGGLNDSDVAEITGLPDVVSVDARKVLALNLLVDQAADYFTLDGYSFAFDYLSEQTDSDLIHTRPHAYENYQLIKERYVYEKELLQVNLGAFEPQVLESLQAYVYEGNINLDRIAAGEEIVLIAPPVMQVTLTSYDDGGFGMGVGGLASLDLAEKPASGKTVLLFENDQFHAGDKITLSLLYSDSPVNHDEAGGWTIPAEDAVRIDKTVTIGALIRPSKTGVGSDIAPLTSLEGLAALGYEAPYTDLRIHLGRKPEPEQVAYLSDQLEMIAYRSDGYNMESWISIAEQARKAVQTVYIVVGALVILFFALVTSMVNNTMTARIRAGRREIGTLRAVGATKRDILRSYDIQMIAQFSIGAVLGCGIGWAICYWISQQPHSPIISLPIYQPMLFLILIFVVCRLNISMKIKQILKESIVANIREL